MNSSACNECRGMVLQRRLDYGFNGYEVPVVPRASRSARGRVPIRRKHEDNPVRAFEILASVAGEFLQAAERSTSDDACGEDRNTIVVSDVEEGESNLMKAELHEWETCEENTFANVPGLQGDHQRYAMNGYSDAQENLSSEINSTSKSFDHSEKIHLADQQQLHVNDRNKTSSCFGTVGRDSPHSGGFLRGNVDGLIETNSEAKLSITENKRSENICFAEQWPYFNNRNASRGLFSEEEGDDPWSGEFFREQVDSLIGRKSGAKPSVIRSTKSRILPVEDSLDTMQLDWKPPGLVRPENNLKLSLFRGRTSCDPFSWRCANIEVYSRHDGDSSVGCTQSGCTVTACRSPSNIIDQRVRKMSASRHWRVTPKLKRETYCKTDWKRKLVYNEQHSYRHQRSPGISPFKRRKLFDRMPLSTSEGIRCKGLFNSRDKRSSGDICVAANGESSSVVGQQAPSKSKSRDCNVKLNIKSFRVPELFIDIPATATVGSLKRTVMEAVTAILGDGLHVGILLQGKTVRDDSKTLRQTGICHDDKHCNLGFMLEPKNAQITLPLHTENPPLLCGGTPQDRSGHIASLTLKPEPSDISPVLPTLNFGSCVDNNINAVCSLVDISTKNTMPDSRDMIAVPAITMEALAVVPFHQKSGHPEFVQRRTRRPFSVSEVEALVQAVEKLGTGRWRDVKLHAFDGSKHRTYVDLKDKWKTLVHTARISPQLRRGEPLPQQLLDRVLAVQAYWSQQQAKQQFKVAG